MICTANICWELVLNWQYATFCFKFKPQWNDSNTFWGHWSFTRRWFRADLYLFWWSASLMNLRCSVEVVEKDTLVWRWTVHCLALSLVFAVQRKSCCGCSLQLFYLYGFSVTCSGCISTVYKSTALYQKLFMSNLCLVCVSERFWFINWLTSTLILDCSLEWTDFFSSIWKKV